MNELELRTLMCQIGKRMYARNLVAASDGNISVRLGPDRFLCTPSGVSKDEMSPEDMMVADGSGKKITGSGKVTSEFFTHLAAYEERPDVKAVIHAHPPQATATTLAGVSMLEPVLPDLVMALGGVPVAPYATPGSPEGGEAVRALVRACDAVLLDRHGAVTLGGTLLEAWFKMEKLEHCAGTLLAAHQAGKVTPLGGPQIDRLLKARAAYGVTWRCYPLERVQ